MDAATCFCSDTHGSKKSIRENVIIMLTSQLPALSCFRVSFLIFFSDTQKTPSFSIPGAFVTKKFHLCVGFVEVNPLT